MCEGQWHTLKRSKERERVICTYDPAFPNKSMKYFNFVKAMQPAAAAANAAAVVSLELELL